MSRKTSVHGYAGDIKMNQQERRIAQLEAEVERLKGAGGWTCGHGPLAVCKDCWEQKCNAAAEMSDTLIKCSHEVERLRGMYDQWPDCGHFKYRNDDSYGNCMVCKYAEFMAENEDEEEMLKTYNRIATLTALLRRVDVFLESMGIGTMASGTDRTWVQRAKLRDDIRKALGQEDTHAAD